MPLKDYRAKSNNMGFSIIELVIALSILLIAATAFLPVFSFVAKSNVYNETRAAANTIAAGIFEEIEGLDYDDVGFAGGNPSGIIPLSSQNQTITNGDFEYNVELMITWGSAVDKDGNINPVAYKNIQVTVEAVNIFTGESQVFDKMYSISARESEQPMNVGNMRVLVKTTENVGLSSPSLNISATGPQVYSLYTDLSGQALFGEIKFGTYKVSSNIPDGFYVPQGETVTGGRVERKDIDIAGWSVKDVFLYMDTMDKYSNLAIQLKDPSGNIINAPGAISLIWNMDGEEKTIFRKDFTNGILDTNLLGRLWPLGTYSVYIEFSEGSGYVDYDMETAQKKPVIDDSGEEWDGTFSYPGESINLTITVEEVVIPVKNAFSRIESEDFDSKSSNDIRIVSCGDTGNGHQIQGMRSGNYTVYTKVDFKDGANYFLARLSSSSNRTITLRIDSATGPIIGTLSASSTGGRYETRLCTVNGVTGIHDLYIVYNGDIQFNWFTFAKFFDDFSNNKIDNAWRTYSGTWSETGGILGQTSTSRQDPKKAIISGAGLDPTKDYIIKARVRVDSSLLSPWTDSDQARAGIGLFTNTSDGRGYNLLFHNNHSTVQFLNDGVSWSPVYTFNWSNNTWYWFMLKSSGNQLSGKIWKDGDPEPSDWMFTWTAPGDIRTGYPALNGGSGNCRVSFDDVTVTIE
jgi:type II secretory pathway pseudopilin PulG